MRRDHDHAEKPSDLEETAEVPGAALPTELTWSIGYLLRRVYAQFAMGMTGDEDDEIDLRHLAVLDALADRDWMSQLDLAEQLGINRTIMVSVIDRLEAQGCVDRTRNPKNRRSYVLSLTDQGWRALKDLRRAAATRDGRLTERLSAADRGRLNELLGRLLPTPYLAPRSTEYRVTHAHYRLRQLGDDRVADTGLRVRHYGPLLALKDLGPCAQRDLAEHLAITEPAAAQLVDELVRAELVRRGRDPHDRRRYALELTEHGHERLTMLHKAVDALQADVAEMLGAGGVAELRALLLRLLEPGATASRG